MGGSIAIGAAAKHIVAAGDITVSHPKQSLAHLFGDITTTRDNTVAVEGADLVIVAVKPWLMAEVLEQIAPHIDPERQAVASIAAGITFGQLAEKFGGRVPALFRIIPNTAIALGHSVTFIASQGATDSQREAVRRLFEALGSVFEIDEEQMQAATALASCGIAYALRYIDAAARGGSELGIDYPTAQRIVMDTMSGALELLRANGTEPQTEIDKVTTPGGITLRGLEAMERAGFSQAVTAGLKASR